MDSALEDRLTRAFPRLYREGLYGECHDGWFALLWRLSVRLEDLISQLPELEQEGYFVVQVKEKFGQLRVYLSHYTEDMFQATEAALKDSGYICEYCGEPGILIHKGGWVMTRCLMHAPSGSVPIET